MYRDLIGILASSRLEGVGFAVDLIARKRYFPDAPPIPYYRALLDCLELAAGVAVRAEEVCEITYDISAENKANAAQLYGSLREGEEKLHKWLHPKLYFARCRESARLQAADLLAFEAWKALDHEVGPIKRKRGSWDLLRATGRFATIAYTEEWFKDLRAHYDSGELQRISGVNEGDYRAWLLKRRRQHNMSNLLEFALK